MKENQNEKLTSEVVKENDSSKEQEGKNFWSVLFEFFSRKVIKIGLVISIIVFIFLTINTYIDKEKGRATKFLVWEWGEDPRKLVDDSLVIEAVEKTQRAYIPPTNTVNVPFLQTAVAETVIAWPTQTKQPQDTKFPTTPTQIQEPINTPTPSPAELPPGEDFKSDCISSKNWTPFGQEDFLEQENGCWVMGDEFGVVANGSLNIASGITTAHKTFELYTDLENVQKVKVTVNIQKLEGIQKGNGYLCMGFAADGSNISQAQGKNLICFYSYISEQEASNWYSLNGVFYKYYSETNLTIISGEEFKGGEKFTLVFDISNLMMDVSISRGAEIPAIKVSSKDIEKFWIIYDLDTGQELIATIEEIEFIP